jgi:hypothetical protein
MTVGGIASLLIWIATGFAYDLDLEYVSHLTWALATTGTLAVVGYALSAHSANLHAARDREQVALLQQMCQAQEAHARALDAREEDLSAVIIHLTVQAAENMGRVHGRVAAGMAEQHRKFAADLLAQQRAEALRIVEQVEVVVGPVATRLSEVIDDMEKTWARHGKKLATVNRKVDEGLESLNGVMRNMGELGKLVADRETSAERRYREWQTKGGDLFDAMQEVVRLLNGRLPDAQVMQLRRPGEEAEGNGKT